MQKLLWKTSFVAVAVATLLSPLASSAAQLTSAQVSAIINLLQSFGADASVVANVQASLTGNNGNHYGQWCHTFNTNLGVGSRGVEVQALMTAISKEPGGPQAFGTNERGRVDDITFEEGLASWVTSFQERFRDEILTPSRLKSGTGYVGPATRKKLNQLYGCGNTVKPPVTFCTQEAKQCSDGSYVSRTGPSCAFAACPPVTQASITVLSPNGEEIWPIGSTQTIRWNSNNFSGGVVTIYLKDSNYNPTTEDNRTQYLVVNQAENTGSYIWIIPNSIGAQSIKTGSNYKIYIRASQTTSGGLLDYDHPVQSDDSDAPFSIVSQ